jgi:hypothetical protein
MTSEPLSGLRLAAPRWSLDGGASSAGLMGRPTDGRPAPPAPSLSDGCPLDFSLLFETEPLLLASFCMAVLKEERASSRGPWPPSAQ